MVYIRGNKRDYDNWAENYGAKGWSWDEVFPFFLKSENNSDWDIITKNPSYHSKGGEMKVSSVVNIEPSLIAFIDSAYNGVHRQIHLNGQSQVGANIPQQTID